MPELNDTFYMGINDTAPALDAIIYKADGVTPQDLTGATVAFEMHDDNGTVVINYEPVTVTEAVNGKVSFSDWTGHTGTAGLYYGRFRVTLSGKVMSAPNDRHILIKISS